MEKQPSPPLLWLTRMLFLQSWWFLFATSTSWKPSNTLLNNITDQAALLTFKSQINLANNNDLSNSWNTNTSFCNWIGVTCSRRGQRVTELDLQGMALEGTIPPHIANLSFLVYLNLSHNNFHGQLPPEIGRLRRLEVIDLGANQMDGMIPPSLSCCEKLNYIRLDFNNLEGTIPPSLGNLSELDYVSLNNNGLYGEIPPAIFNISSLIVMILSYNMLSGSLPADTGRFLPNLEELRLYGNWISGAIPISLSNASKLTILNLGDNSLNGSIPDTLGNLLQLENLSLANNTLTEYGLEGKVSAKGDVYSYGILLLEMLTRKKPTDSMFTGSLSLRQWVNAAFPDEMMDVIDMNLLREIGSCENNGKEAGDPHERQLSLLLSIVEVGLFCSKEFPEERIGMKDVVVKLMKIKNEFCQ